MLVWYIRFVVEKSLFCELDLCVKKAFLNEVEQIKNHAKRV